LPAVNLVLKGKRGGGRSLNALENQFSFGFRRITPNHSAACRTLVRSFSRRLLRFTPLPVIVATKLCFTCTAWLQLDPLCMCFAVTICCLEHCGREIANVHRLAVSSTRPVEIRERFYADNFRRWTRHSARLNAKAVSEIAPNKSIIAVISTRV